jgi:hypothetical protein
MQKVISFYKKTKPSFQLRGLTKNIMLTLFAATTLVPSYGQQVSSYTSEVGNKVGGRVRNSILINFDEKINASKITPLFYGTQTSFLTPLPESRAASNLGLGMVRIGGNLYDRYDWRSNTFTFNGRTISDQPRIEEIVSYVKKMGASPLVQLNLLGELPNNSNDRRNEQSVAGLIRYLNGTKKLNVRNFCLGNEFAEWGDTHHDIWPEDAPLITADEYIDRFIKYAILIRRTQESISGNPNDVKIWGPEISVGHNDWQTGNITKDCEYTSRAGVLKCRYGKMFKKFDHFLPYFFHRLAKAEKNRRINPRRYKLLDFATFHYYPNFRTNNDDPDSIISDRRGYQRVSEMLAATQLFHDPNYVNRIDTNSLRGIRPNLLGRMKEWLKNYPGAKLALTEFAVDSQDMSLNYHPVIRPLYMADLIGILANNDVAHFTRVFLNSYNPEYLPWSLLIDDKLTNLGTLYKLFSSNFLGRLVLVEDSLDDRLNAYGAMDEAGQFNLVVVNKSANSITSKVNYRSSGRTGSLLEHNFSPWSVTLFKIPVNKFNRRGTEVRVFEHGAREMGVRIDPYYTRQ